MIPFVERYCKDVVERFSPFDRQITRALSKLLANALKFYLDPVEQRALALRSVMFVQQSTVPDSDIPPWLTKVVESAARNVIAHWHRIVTSLSNQSEELNQTKILEGGGSDPVGLETVDSDLHDGGAFTAIVVLAGGERIVHKTRDMQVEALLARLIRQVLGPSCIEVPAMKETDDGCLWQKFVPAKRQSVSPKILLDVGRFIGFAQLVGLVDLHPANLIQSGKKVFLIDAETIFHPIQHEVLKVASVEGQVLSLGLTPLSTSLLPSWSLSIRGRNPVLEATLVGDLLSQWVSEGVGTHQDATACLLRGYSDFVYGSEASVAKACMELRKGKRFLVRQVCRSTAAYSLIVQQAVTRCLSNPREDFAGHLSRLLALNTTEKNATEEVKALLLGDIPKWTESIESEKACSLVEANQAAMRANIDLNLRIIAEATGSLVWTHEEAAWALSEKGAYRFRTS